MAKRDGCDRPGRAAPRPAGMARTDYIQRREMTLEERLAEERIVFLWGEITPGNGGALIMRLLELQAKGGDRDIHLYINSPGGSVDDTLAVYDTMQFLECNVATYCVGQAAAAPPSSSPPGARANASPCHTPRS